MAESLHGRLIYKDECTKCFLTPKDEHGLNVCLATLVGSCANPGAGHAHSEAHVARSGHPIFMNIKMTPKAEPTEEAGAEPKPQEITKLAIGKPGGIDAE